MQTVEQKHRVLSNTLKRLEQKEYLPKDLISLLGQTAAIQLNAQQEISIKLPDLEIPFLTQHIAKGGSVLTPETLPLDYSHISNLFSQLLGHITDQPDGLPDAMVKAALLIGKALKHDEIDLFRAVHECLTGTGPIMEYWAEQTCQAPAALNFLVRASLEPSLTATVTALAEWLAGHSLEETIRQTGSCPICGSLPYMVELRDKEGFRFAVCSLCRHEYRIRRLACPVCDNSDTEKLKFFTVPEEPGFRVDACDCCKFYIKTIDFRAMDRKSFPSLNDLESLALDFLAAEQGYSRSAVSVWGI